MDSDAHAIFREAARRNSFAAAARALDIDPSAVSRSITALEARLEVRLFERSTRRVELTEAGALYLARIDPLLDEFEDAAQAARDLTGTLTGTLRVTASTAFGEAIVVPMLAGFMAEHTDLNVELILTDSVVDLLADRIDVAIRLTPDAPPDTIVTKLADTRYRVVAAPPYLAKNPISQPADLSGHDCLRFPIPGFSDNWLFRKNGKTIEVAVSGRLTILGARALLRAAMDGQGPALLADWLIADALADGRLTDVFPECECAAGGFDTAAWGLTPSRSYRPRKTTVFLEALRAHLRVHRT
ncbi:MAG: LysR family transcriptional regulator [Paracoccaceae bacterium]|nr:LysR family transcriptional regulator [Paracoccaceae bacterium]